MAGEIVAVEFAGLRELAQSLRELNAGLLEELRDELARRAEPVRADAQRLFAHWRTEGVSAATAASYERTAAGFEVRVRPFAGVAVVVAQRLSSVTGRRGDYGGLEMRKALLPARWAHLAQIAEGLEARVAQLMEQV